MGKEFACRVLVGKPEEKRSLGRPKSRREVIIKNQSFRNMMVGLKWIHLASDADQWRALVG
jgi:hypothetical protein